jgi:hypothetical protein
MGRGNKVGLSMFLEPGNNGPAWFPHLVNQISSACSVIGSWFLLHPCLQTSAAEAAAKVLIITVPDAHARPLIIDSSLSVRSEKQGG